MRPVIPRWRPSAISSSASRVLPTPGSPPIITRAPRPPATWSRQRRNSARSASRPTNGGGPPRGGRGGDAGGGVHRPPEQVVLLADHLARVQAHADPDLVTRGLAAVVLLERALDADGAGNGLARGAEGDHEAVAHRLYFAAAVLLHLLPHELLVGAQDIPRSLIPPTHGQARGAF